MKLTAVSGQTRPKFLYAKENTRFEPIGFKSSALGGTQAPEFGLFVFKSHFGIMVIM